MAGPVPPRQLIFTGIGWLLLESLVHGSVLEQLAKTAAAGASLDGEDKEKTQEACRKNLRLWDKGRRPQPEPLEALNDWITGAVRHQLRKTPPASRRPAR